jgi:AcrR family transcriptional regulator
MEQPGLRERKRERTRRALVDAATALFSERGYEETTIAEIAAAAEIGTRTFFGYFASKEELVFPEVDARVRAVDAVLAARGPADGPVDVLLRALQAVVEDGHDMVGPQAALRMRLTRTVPAVRGRALQLQLDAQHQIAGRLTAAFPELTAVDAGALVGAFVGAVSGAVQALTRDASPDLDEHDRERILRSATERALRPWRSTPP